MMSCSNVSSCVCRFRTFCELNVLSWVIIIPNRFSSFEKVPPFIFESFVPDANIGRTCCWQTECILNTKVRRTKIFKRHTLMAQTEWSVRTEPIQVFVPVTYKCMQSRQSCSIALREFRMHKKRKHVTHSGARISMRTNWKCVFEIHGLQKSMWTNWNASVALDICRNEFLLNRV